MNIWETKEGEDGIEALRNISEELCIANELKQQELKIREQELAIKDNQLREVCNLLQHKMGVSLIMSDN